MNKDIIYNGTSMDRLLEAISVDNPQKSQIQIIHKRFMPAR